MRNRSFPVLMISGYFSEVAAGLRNLSKGKIPGFARALELDERESAFLERLVAFNDAKSSQAKQLLYEQVLKALPSQAQQVKLSQMEYFSKWYYGIPPYALRTPARSRRQNHPAVPRDRQRGNGPCVEGSRHRHGGSGGTVRPGTSG